MRGNACCCWCSHVLVGDLPACLAAGKLFLGGVQDLEHALRERVRVGAFHALQHDLNVAKLAKIKISLLLQAFHLRKQQRSELSPST